MTFLSEPWLARSVDLAGDEPVAGGFSGEVDATVTGGPDGDLRVWCRFERGRLVAGGHGQAADGVVGLTLAYADARGVLAGEADLNALFISGRMKVAGATAPLLDLLAASKGSAFTELLAHLDAETG